MNTYGPDLLDDQGQMPEYRELVEGGDHPEVQDLLRAAGVAAAEQTVTQAGLARTAKVFATGVSAIDDDSATALVAGTFTDSYPKGKGRARASEPCRSGSR